jgi:hypothetical protein
MSSEREPAFGPLVPTCAQYGIKRTQAFELAKRELIEVFKIGNKPFVTHSSLRSLPQRLASQTREVS